MKKMIMIVTCLTLASIQAGADDQLLRDHLTNNTKMHKASQNYRAGHPKEWVMQKRTAHKQHVKKLLKEKNHAELWKHIHHHDAEWHKEDVGKEVKEWREANMHDNAIHHFVEAAETTDPHQKSVAQHQMIAHQMNAHRFMNT
jgi:hypothetical protein